jgi:hypothetical protein
VNISDGSERAGFVANSDDMVAEIVCRWEGGE